MNRPTKKEQIDNLNGFRQHGVNLDREASGQMVGDCPFCAKEGHFYVNKETKLWDCKRCGERGNFEDFLSAVAQGYSEGLTEERLRALADDRGLPVGAFRNLGIGWTGNRYSIPVQNNKGRTLDIRLYRPGGKLLSTPTATTGLFNLRDLVLEERKKERVYICEGEWDTIAWRWLLLHLDEPGVVVGVPGANTFKGFWVPFFEGRDVVILYDNDAAGRSGELIVRAKLSGTTKSIRYLHWPAIGLDEGYDIRDHVKKVALLENHPPQAFEQITDWLKNSPREGALEGGASGSRSSNGEVIGEITESYEPITTKELIADYKKWLHMKSDDALKVMYGAILANKMGGDPLWLFLVAPPGGMKSELLMSLSKGEGVHALSSLTPHTLISGATWKEGQDPSLLPKLNNKILIVKDFTTLLTLHHSVRDEIFGTLRDVYDGNTEKIFGNGVRRKYESSFGILAGVTPAIEAFNTIHAGLGERFLKFRLCGNWDQDSEEAKIMRALNNIGREGQMRNELTKIGCRWLANMKLPEIFPELTHDRKLMLVHLAKWAARLRGVVERDRFSGTVMYKPSSEVGTRLAKQLAKLGQGIAMFLEKKAVDDEVYELVRRVALDTVPDRVEDIVHALWDATGGDEGTCSTTDIVIKTRLPQATVFRCLQDMNLLKLVENMSAKGVAAWRLSAKLTEHIKIGGVYVGKTKAVKKGLSIRSVKKTANR